MAEQRADHSIRPNALRMVRRATSIASRTPNAGNATNIPQAGAGTVGRAEQLRAKRRDPLADADQHQSGEDEADQPAEQGIERDPALEQAGDLDVGRAHQMQDLDRAAMGVERGARGEDHGGGGGADHQEHQAGGEPFERADQRGQRRQPLAIVVDPRRGRDGGDRAAQPVERAMRLGVRSTSISAGTGMSLSTPPAPSQGSSRPGLASGTGRTSVTPGSLRIAAAAAARLGRGAVRIGLDDLDGDARAISRRAARRRRRGRARPRRRARSGTS